MTFSTDIRDIADETLTEYSGTGTLYSYADATKEDNDEGEVTITDWGSGTSIIIVSSNHWSTRRILARQGEETDKSDRGFLVKSSVNALARDKLVVDDVTYEVVDIKKIDPTQNTLILQRLIVSINEAY